MQGEGDSAQSSQHSHSIHGYVIDLGYAPHPPFLPDRIHIVRKRFRSDTSGVIQVDLPSGSGTAIAIFMHFFHNLPGLAPNRAPLPDLKVMADDLSVDGVYTATLWGCDTGDPVGRLQWTGWCTSGPSQPSVQPAGLLRSHRQCARRHSRPCALPGPRAWLLGDVRSAGLPGRAQCRC